MFSFYLGVLEAMSRLGENATVGNIQKMNLHLTRGQVQRVLNSLEGEMYIAYRVEKHGRTGKKVYYALNLCVTNVFITSKALDEAGYIPMGA